MLTRVNQLERINNSIAILSREVEINSSVNFTNINVAAEDFYCAFLNLILKTELRNLNESTSNFVALDLGCDKTGLSIQVTSTSSITKVRKTVEKYVSSGNNKRFKDLIVLTLGEATDYRTNTIDVENFSFDVKKNVWSYKTIGKKLLHVNEVILKELLDLLEKAGVCDPLEAEPKEVTTFVELINLISDDEHPEAGTGFLEEPDPERKINKRFKNHSDEIIAEYKDNFSIYGNVLQQIKGDTDISNIKIRKASNYLRKLSHDLLKSCSGNPIEALDKLQSFYIKKLSKLHFEYDEQAVNFYLINELTGCNVFPNIAAISHE